MDAGTAELFDLLVGWTVGAGATYAILAFDERRMTPAQRERAWPVATRRIAIFVLGPLSLVVHFVKTRWTFASIALGVAAVALAVAVTELVGVALDWVAGVPG
jgi:hypothetical protein